MTSRYLWTIVLLLVWSGPARTGQHDPITTIEVTGRPAAEVAQVIRPLLAPGDALSVSGNLLILRTDARRLAEIRKLVGQLDKPLRNLMIHVRHSAGRTGRDAGIAASGSVGVGDDGRVSVGRPAEADRLDVRGHRDDSREQSAGDYQVRTLEGQPAFIYTGQERIYPRAELAPQGGVNTRSSIPAQRGFYVIPRVHGDSVTLQIAPSSDRFAGRRNTIDTNRIVTTVNGRVGEWIRLGRIDESGDQAGRGIGAYHQQSLTGYSAYEVRVELVP